MVDASEDFHEVSEIMSRHATLLATNKDLQQQQQRVTDLAEEARCVESIPISQDNLERLCTCLASQVFASANMLCPSLADVERCMLQRAQGSVWVLHLMLHLCSQPAPQRGATQGAA